MLLCDTEVIVISESFMEEKRTRLARFAGSKILSGATQTAADVGPEAIAGDRPLLGEGGIAHDSVSKRTPSLRHAGAVSGQGLKRRCACV